MKGFKHSPQATELDRALHQRKMNCSLCSCSCQAGHPTASQHFQMSVVLCMGGWLMNHHRPLTAPRPQPLVAAEQLLLSDTQSTPSTQGTLQLMPEQAPQPSTPVHCASASPHHLLLNPPVHLLYATGLDAAMHQQPTTASDVATQHCKSLSLPHTRWQAQQLSQQLLVPLHACCPSCTLKHTTNHRSSCC